MRYRKRGKWGLKVSEISLGAWVTFGDVVKDKETVREIVGNRLRRGRELL